ncbi:hypothetical protein DNTS_023781 [Danionella cerebrum]|uniref:Neurensin-1 n=1 Tax=Danionella cerebrum TaxID=2873325 RepID=A0A553QV86_9TELE|nr:hypothetical protein DNTS_023781 [Danionella translucida]
MASCQELCGSDRPEQGAAGALSGDHGEGFGVRSYLHQFYEECTGSAWESEHTLQMQRARSRWRSIVWKACFSVGAVLSLCGLSVLLVGFLTSPRLESFGQEDLLFVDGRAVRFNQALEGCKLAGAVLISVGTAGVVLGLMMGYCVQRGASKEGEYLWGFAEQPTGQTHTHTPGGDGTVPITLSRVQNVQPRTLR